MVKAVDSALVTQDEIKPIQLASAQVMGSMPDIVDYGGFYMPGRSVDSVGQSLGLTAEKLIVPKEYHQVLQMVYDFYQRGGMASTVINRLAEFTVTPIRNGQRQTSDEVKTYFDALLSSAPSRLMRFIRDMSKEYWLSGLILPRIDWVTKLGSEIHPDLRPTKTYVVPQFDMYPPLLIQIQWAGWGQKDYYLRIPSSDVKLIRAGGSRIKAQQNKYIMWQQNYPAFVQQIQSGLDSIKLTDVDPILRAPISISPYPTPYLFPVLEPLIFRQQLRRMDFAVAARVINAILLVQEGSDEFPLVAMDDPTGVNPSGPSNLTALRNQILARSNNPLLLERLFILFSNHTTKLTWIQPDVSAMLNQDKYRQVNEELQEGLGFTSVLITGESRQAQASEVSTWAIQPQMDEFRSMVVEWMTVLYQKAGELNSFNPRKLPVPTFRPIKLQDFVKTAATIAQAFKEGNVSRTTRAESVGLDLETEVELMRDEQVLLKGLPSFQPTPYSPPPPNVGGGGTPGRPPGSTNVPLNNRNVGVKPSGQKPLSKIAAETVDLLPDDEVIELINKVAQERGITITPEMIIDSDPE